MVCGSVSALYVDHLERLVPTGLHFVMCPHRVAKTGMCVCVCVFVPVLRIRPTLSVHGAETLSKLSEALSLCSPIFIVNVICRPMLYFGERVRESERERERARARASEVQYASGILNRRPNEPPFLKVGQTDLRTNGFRFRNIEPSA
jgi:hypothetical protein